MFGNTYWPQSYWAPSYWPKTGAELKAGGSNFVGGKRAHRMALIMAEMAKQEADRRTTAYREALQARMDLAEVITRAHITAELEYHQRIVEAAAYTVLLTEI